MAITNFISTVWSEALIRQLDHKYVAVANCNRDYDGDIVGKGSTVKVCSVGAVTVSDYTKNTNMSAPQTLSDSAATISISQAKSFNFQIDDLDRVQSRPEMMKTALNTAAATLAATADTYVYSLVKNAGKSVTCTPSGASDLINAIIDARTLLFAQNVTDPSEISVEVAPVVAAQILKEKAALCTDNTECLEHGYIGSIAGCKIYVSNQISSTDDASAKTKTYNCCVRTRRAVTFAEQLSEIEAYRPESRFADAVKGLHLYGAKVIYPQELIALKVTYSTAG